MTKEEDEVKEAIIKVLSKKIVKELNKKEEFKTRPIELDYQGRIRDDLNYNVRIYDVADSLIRELAEKRLAYGITMKKEPDIYSLKDIKTKVNCN
jgi:hypothetical protein